MNNQAPGLQKELFSPRGSLICVLLEALSCALSPQGLPRFLRETPRHSSQDGMATTRFPFLRTRGHLLVDGEGHLEEGREGGTWMFLAE